jgi:hypothetical protein
MKANCFDKNSKLILQLNNGKIIITFDQENCGTMIRDDKGFDNRITRISCSWKKALKT